MSGQRVRDDLDATVVVHVEETVTPALVGRDGLEYQSPPQPRAEALALVRLLLGRGAAPQAHEVRWRCPIAGGQRTITLEPVPDLKTAGRGGQPANGALP